MPLSRSSSPGWQFNGVGIKVSFQRLNFFADESLHGLGDHPLLFGHEHFHLIPPLPARLLDGLRST